MKRDAIDPEILTTELDSRGARGGLPDNSSLRRSSRDRRKRGKGATPIGARRPALWGLCAVFDGERSDFHAVNLYGTYPRGFIDFALRALGVPAAEVLHVCSGALTSRDVQGGVRVDLDPARTPDVVADGRKLPFADGSFSGVLIDPPYTVEYARDLYGCDYPRPSHLLAEASRVVRPNGVIGFLHFLVPHSPEGLRFERCYGVTQGLGYRIRAFTIYRREQELLDFTETP